MIIIWILLTAVLFIAFHKVFFVMYSGNIFAAIIKELAICAVIAIIIMQLCSQII